MSEFGRGISFEDDPIHGGVEVQKVLNSPLAEWAISEEQAGAVVRLKHLFQLRDSKGNSKVHNVAWISRDGINPDTAETYSYHFAACDCLPLSEALGDIGLMCSCSEFATGLVGRAHAVRGNPTLQTILESPPDHEIAERYGINDFNSVDPRVVEAIMYLLRLDKEHPEAWVGNFRSGSHEVVLLSQILGQDTEETKEYAVMMEALGLIYSPNGVDIQLAA